MNFEQRYQAHLAGQRLHEVREAEVQRLLALGVSQREIARVLGMNQSVISSRAAKGPSPWPGWTTDRAAEFDRDPQTGCWVWNAHRNRGGYGVANIGGHPVAAHRLLYRVHVGPIDDGLHLDHLCRNPPCVNPAHLEPVTPAENSRRRSSTRITRDEAAEIRQSAEPGVVLAARYGISAQQVCNIRKGRVWAEAAA